jgi:tetratricopeptide (TPR) repeat protein
MGTIQRSLLFGMALNLVLGGVALGNPLDEPQSPPPRPAAPAARSAQQAFDEGVQLMKAKRFDEAAAAFQQAVKARPDFAEAHSNLGYSLRNSGRLDQAIASYQEAIRLKPNLAEAREYLGVAYVLKGDRQAALEQYQVLQRLDPRMAAELLEEIEKGGEKPGTQRRW